MNTVDYYLKGLETPATSFKDIDKEKLKNNILSILPENVDENGDNQYDVVIKDNSIIINDDNKEENKYGNITPMIHINDMTFIGNDEVTIFFETPDTNIEYLIDTMKAIVKAIKDSK